LSASLWLVELPASLPVWWLVALPPACISEWMNILQNDFVAFFLARQLSG
jgi:hypothetical protein